MIDSLSERYGMLPSDVYLKATTFDVLIFDAAASYRKYIQNKDNKDFSNYDQDSLQEMMDQIRST